MAVGVAMAARLKLVSLPSSLRSHRSSLSPSSSRNSSAAPTISASQFTTTTTTTTSSNPNFKLNMPCSSSSSPSSSATDGKVIDSHLHVWASPQEAAAKYPYFPGQEPTLTGHLDFLLQIYVKFSALFRVSRRPFPYQDLSHLLSQIVSSFGANRIMWGSDFPFVVLECGYKGAIDAVSVLANEISLSSTELEWIKGKTVAHLFQNRWIS